MRTPAADPFAALERQLAPQEVAAAGRQRRDAQVRDAVREMIVRMCGLSALHLGVERLHEEPRLRWIAELADRGARVAQEEPARSSS